MRVRLRFSVIFPAFLLAFLLAPACLTAETPDEISWRVLDRGLHDGNPLKRKQAVLAMSLLRPQPRPVALIEGALNDPDASIREAACATLGEIKSRTSIPKLQMALADGVPEVIFAAAKALFNMNDQAGREVLTAILLGEQTDASGFVSGSIRSMRLKLHDPREIMLMGIKEGAGFAGPFGMSVPVAEGLLKDTQSSGKTVAALLLATDYSPESLAAMKDSLSDKNWTVRAAAARAVGMREATGLYDNVATLLDDKKEEVAYSAAAALIRLKQSQAQTKVNDKDNLTYRWIPPGAFIMGCSVNDKDCAPQEKPAHQVTITTGFWMGQTPVTQEAWQKVMGANTAKFNFKGPKLPAESVTWKEAQSYCLATGMRLPTEAEWEYAARAGSTGSRYGELNQIAWYAGNSRGRTHDVMQKQPNPWGLYDMLGNVYQWTADWYMDGYPATPETDPQGPPAGQTRAVRGGSFGSIAGYIRVSDRVWDLPEVHLNDIGFRCVGN